MQVYLMYKDMLYNVSLRIIKNEQDAQDMVHDAFIKAFQNISKLEISAYLVTLIGIIFPKLGNFPHVDHVKLVVKICSQGNQDWSMSQYICYIC